MAPRLAVAALASIAVIDDEMLRELERILGKSKMAALAVSFRGRLAAAIDTITSTMDRAQMAWEAHSLVSFSGNLGCQELVSCTRELMGALKEGEHAVAPLVAGIAAAATRALAAMNQHYPP